MRDKLLGLSSRFWVKTGYVTFPAIFFAATANDFNVRMGLLALAAILHSFVCLFLARAIEREDQ